MKILCVLFASLFIFEIAAATSLTGVDDKEKTSKKAQKKYCYLSASNRNIDTGDTYVFTSVFAIDETTWDVEKLDLLERFDEVLYEMYPQSTFEVGIQSIQGIYNSKEDAENNKKQLLQQKVKANCNTAEISFAPTPTS
ncbi:hypothetical protein AAG747_12555 [Rapidithrix thailandica]|uniref:Uncharacterized protein n=1 Tax=Rapidithrix thailandica TaxID=413964 RepID=A0AAW9S8G9_9BACT